eukprot:scaffold131014_cov51-Phaeocystis_antarctica.AAC.1
MRIRSVPTLCAVAPFVVAADAGRAATLGSGLGLGSGSGSGLGLGLDLMLDGMSTRLKATRPRVVGSKLLPPHSASYEVPG